MPPYLRASLLSHTLEVGGYADYFGHLRVGKPTVKRTILGTSDSKKPHTKATLHYFTKPMSAVGALKQQLR